MPLPPALLERLKRRKIIQHADPEDADTIQKSSRSQSSSSPEKKGTLDSENQLEKSGSIESDDDAQEASHVSGSEDEQEVVGEAGSRTHERQEYESVMGCPNKYNIYHTCEDYCQKTYGKLEPHQLAPSRKQRQHLALLLKTYPMSNDWTVVYDPGVKTFYFWNIISGHVSWTPPGMSTFVSPSADQIRRAYLESEHKNQHSSQSGSETQDCMEATVSQKP